MSPGVFQLANGVPNHAASIQADRLPGAHGGEMAFGAFELKILRQKMKRFPLKNDEISSRATTTTPVPRGHVDSIATLGTCSGTD